MFHKDSGRADLGVVPRAVLLSVLLFAMLFKAGLIAGNFMHLKYEPKGIRIIALAPILPAILLVVIIMTEY